LECPSSGSSSFASHLRLSSSNHSIWLFFYRPFLKINAAARIWIPNMLMTMIK
jgi:hypothetical protein